MTPLRGACGRRKPYSAGLKLSSKMLAKKVLEDSGFSVSFCMVGA